jgi:4-alpha-glucanotransferase
MTANDESANVPPFPAEYRASGLLLHLTSLPSPYGIGDLGSSAFSWINRLHDAGQRWWQSLPLGPTGYGDSPYQPMSSFAGNDMLISPGSLILDDLLTEKDCVTHFPADVVDYDAVIPFKIRLLDIAWKRFKAGRCSGRIRPEYDQFRAQHQHWLEDYALFRALKLSITAPTISSGLKSWFIGAPKLWPRHTDSWQRKSIRSGLRSSSFSARAIN